MLAVTRAQQLLRWLRNVAQVTFSLSNGGTSLQSIFISYLQGYRHKSYIALAYIFVTEGSNVNHGDVIVSQSYRIWRNNTK